MPVFIYDMIQLEEVMRVYRNDIGLLHNQIRRLEQFQLNRQEKVLIPDNTVAILLPESDICIFRFKIEYSAIEWVTRQFKQLKNYDFSLLAKTKPTFIDSSEHEDVPPELKQFVMKHFTWQVSLY
ncbi:hypothetical protein NB640_00330 [Oxalobacter vibrioformis]|uniref:Uncharacterized protein n=1 Tax=Oxalobacter vibrioformis TaxID=933080 RepID=A0A9E9LWU5_9BURK|nr:hypothetical protein [Oxalobacter vibrioformis]WAW10157.1 hypothetical protein NB640_00330 [Oxalobacter vibrioformis]